MADKTTERDDPYLSLRFAVDLGIPGVKLGFTKVSGLTMEFGVVEVKEVTGLNLSWQLPDRGKVGPVTLERGLTNSQALYYWFESCQANFVSGGGKPNAQGQRSQFPRTTVTVMLFGKGSSPEKPAYSWVLHDAWPTKFVGGDLDSSSGNVVVESLELAVEGIDRLYFPNTMKPTGNIPSRFQGQMIGA